MTTSPRETPETDGMEFTTRFGTARDYFAAKALPALIAKIPALTVQDSGRLAYLHEQVTAEEGGKIRAAVAALAYEYADAMLAERSRP